jgi:hypothetical protein
MQCPEYWQKNQKIKKTKNMSTWIETALLLLFLDAFHFFFFPNFSDYKFWYNAEQKW